MNVKRILVLCMALVMALTSCVGCAALKKKPSNTEETLMGSESVFETEAVEKEPEPDAPKETYTVNYKNVKNGTIEGVLEQIVSECESTTTVCAIPDEG